MQIGCLAPVAGHLCDSLRTAQTCLRRQHGLIECNAATDRPFSCHLCLSDAHGSSLGYFGSELCERCYHQMTSAQTKDRFTDGLVQLHTGARII